MTIKCWRATHTDIDTLVMLAKEFHSLSPFSPYKFSPSGSRQHFQAMMRCPYSTILMHDNGLIGGSVADYPFCDMKIAKEAFWFAREDGLCLLKAYQEWVNDMGANIDLISSLEIEGQSAKLIERALKMYGYQTVEHTHMRIV